MIIPFLAQLLYGFANPINKYALTVCSASFFTSTKLLFAGIILLIMHRWYKKESIAIPMDQWQYYAHIILFGMIGTHSLKYWGLSQMSATTMAYLYSSFPWPVALVSYIRFGDRLTYKQMLGMCIVACGVIPCITLPTLFSWPALALLIASVFHAISSTSKRILARKQGYWPLQIQGVCFVISGLCTFIPWLIFDGQVSGAHMSMAGLCVIGTMLITKVCASSLNMYAMKYYSTTFLALMGSWYPLCVALCSKLMWGIPLPDYFGIATLCTIIGQYLFYQDELAMQQTPWMLATQTWSTTLKNSIATVSIAMNVYKKKNMQPMPAPAAARWYRRK